MEKISSESVQNVSAYTRVYTVVRKGIKKQIFVVGMKKIKIKGEIICKRLLNTTFVCAVHQSPVNFIRECERRIVAHFF